jgi:hypothetical protein
MDARSLFNIIIQQSHCLYKHTEKTSLLLSGEIFPCIRGIRVVVKVEIGQALQTGAVMEGAIHASAVDFNIKIVSGAKRRSLS